MAKRIVVVFTPPHYKNSDGFPVLWLGRINRAIRITNQQQCPVIIAGDANGGKDLERFFLHAKRNGVRAVVQAFNGNDPAFKNTRGDAKAIARVIGEVPALGRAREIVIVSCWYHIPRCWIALRQELGDHHARISCSPVWSKIWHGIKALPNEIRGCVDYLRRRPQVSRGEPIGKPDFE
jgi:hypothetical protein